MIPKYRFSPSFYFKIARSLLSGKVRSFQADALEFFAHQPGLLEVQGREFIPQSGPCVITFNHYHRPGFHAWWMVLALASIIPREVHWVATNELTFPGKWYGFVGRPASRWFMKKISSMYSFTGMPPMPPRPKDTKNRARAVRQVLNFINQNENPLLGLAPEGSDQPGGILSMPAAGSGRFGLLLASKGLRFSPVGIFESKGALILNFGPQYSLHVPEHLSPQQKDREAARIIMEHIADLLPDHLRGDFA